MAVQKYELKSTSTGDVSVETNMANSSPRITSSRICMVVLVTIIIGLAIAVIVLAVNLHRAKQAYSENATFSPLNSSQISSKDYCLTPACIEAANRMTSHTDTSYSPCDNFYQYSCGGWEAKSRWLKHLAYGTSKIDEVDADNSYFFREQLELDIDHEPNSAYQKARLLYKQCMNTRLVDEFGLKEPLTIIQSIGGIHVNITESYPEFDITARIIELMKLGTMSLVGVTYDFHQGEANTMLLSLTPPESPLLFTQQDNAQIWLDIADEYFSIWKDLISDSYPQLSSDLRSFIEIYKTISEIKNILDKPAIKDFYEPWNETVSNVTELDYICPSINWTRIISELTNHTDNEIIVSNKAYFSALEQFVNNTPPRLLDNALKLLFVIDNREYFAPKYSEYESNLINRVLFANAFWNPAPRWNFCVSKLRDVMPEVLGSWYVRFYVENQDQVIEDIDEMIENIRAEYIQTLQNTTLLDINTRDYAIRKIMAMDKQVAFPKELYNLTRLVEDFKYVEANVSSSFFMNLVQTELNKGLNQGVVGMTEEELDEMWLDYSFVVNGFYSANLNRFTILSGILQGSFYGYRRPKYLNYGFMGFTIGHEFTHGFDDTGRHYDIDGVMLSWWTPESERKFNSAKQCFINQYNNLHVRADKSNSTFLTNGNGTLDENLADNGAVSVAFEAYQKWMLENGEEKLIPADGLTDWRQMFFVSLAQGWCSRYTDVGLRHLLSTFEHSQKEARVNGMLMNSPLFSEAFQCPVGSHMNPASKCTLW